MNVSQLRESLCIALGLTEGEVLTYPSSFSEIQGGTLLLVKVQGKRALLFQSEPGHNLGTTWEPSFQGEQISTDLQLCPLTHQNRKVLNYLLPWTLPSAFGRTIPTFGVGDRLGLATPGHIAVLSQSKAKPILAQQSKRELDLTGRTYQQVLDDVSFAVFQEGYQGGFGADGDHLKYRPDIQGALADGYSMITLDCSEQIGRGIDSLTSEELVRRFQELPWEERDRLEQTYLKLSFPAGHGSDGTQTWTFDEDTLMRCALTYGKAIDFVEEVYRGDIAPCGRPVDFELSIDETEAITTPQDHFFVALELEARGIQITSLAPRFVGEFQKGIDYIGDLAALKTQLEQHARIADHFGYKLSIHSGSDKFSAFPLIGQATGGRLHLKTSGTNWLEAVGTIAICNPSLYRRMHQLALVHFEEAKKFYHVSADPSLCPYLDQTSDDTLPGYLEDDNSRQLLHVTYGFLLKDPEIRSELYQTLEEQDELYRQRLIHHIGRHLKLIGLDLEENR